MRVAARLPDTSSDRAIPRRRRHGRRRTAGRRDLRDKARAILLSCANNLTFRAAMTCWPRTATGKTQDHARARFRIDAISRDAERHRRISPAWSPRASSRPASIRLRCWSRAGLDGRADRRSQRPPQAQSQIRLLEFAAERCRMIFSDFIWRRIYDLREIGLLYYVLASSDITGRRPASARNAIAASQMKEFHCKPALGKETAIALSYVGIDRRSDRHHMEFWLMSLVRLVPAAYQSPCWCRAGSGSCTTGKRRPPSSGRSSAARSNSAPTWTRWFFRRAVKLMPVVSADPYLNELLLKYFEEALAHRPANGATLRSSVENAITPLLPHGKANAGEVARQLGMSNRTLARRLAAEELTFSEIQTELKTDLAKRYLRRRRPADLPDRLAARLPRSQRLHPRVQALDRNGAAAVTGARASLCPTATQPRAGQRSAAAPGATALSSLSKPLRPPRRRPRKDTSAATASCRARCT